MRCSTDEFRLKLRKTVFVNYRNYETLLAMRSDDALASAFVASALPGFRTASATFAETRRFCEDMDSAQRRFQGNERLLAGYSAACPPERGGCGG